jgi:hypothetical protein
MLEFFEKLVSKTSVKHTFIKQLNSKGPGKHPVALTIDDIDRGYVLDADGYKNEIVLFLRKDKKDR